MGTNLIARFTSGINEAVLVRRCRYLGAKDDERR